MMIFCGDINAQEESCADDISPGSKISRSNNDFLSCLILQGRDQKRVKKKTFRKLQKDFIRFCARDTYCRNNLFKTSLVNEKCFDEGSVSLCHVVIKFVRIKTKYDEIIKVKDAVIQHGLFRDKNALHLGLSPTTGFMADFIFRKTNLNRIGWQIGFALFQDFVTVANVNVPSTNPIYADQNKIVSMGGFTTFLGASYNQKIGSFWLVPQVNFGFARLTVSDDPWFGKDILDSNGNATPHELVSSYTFMLSGSFLFHLDNAQRDNWFIKTQMTIYGESYAPMLITLGIGKQFSL